MFDIGFWELALIGVVALLVVGPERLPELARNVGRWVGRIRRYVSAVRDDIEREIRAEELKELMEKSKRSNPLSDLAEETGGALGTMRKQLESAEKEFDDEDGDEKRSEKKERTEPDEDRGHEATGAEKNGASPADPAAAADTVGEAFSTRRDQADAVRGAPPSDSAAESDVGGESHVSGSDERSEDNERRSG